VLTSTLVGTTSECRGTSSTSSNVSAVVRPVSIERRAGDSVFSIDSKRADRGRPIVHAAAPWHFLYFFPLPHGQGSLRPTFGSSRGTVMGLASSPPTRAGCGGRGGPTGDGSAALGRAPTAEPADSPPLRMRGDFGRAAGRGAGGKPPSSFSTGRSHH